MYTLDYFKQDGISRGRLAFHMEMKERKCIGKCHLPLLDGKTFLVLDDFKMSKTDIVLLKNR